MSENQGSTDPRLTELEGLDRQRNAILLATADSARVHATEDLRAAQEQNVRMLNAIREMQKEHGQRLDGIDGRLDGIDGRLDGIDGRLGRIERLLRQALGMSDDE